MEKRYFFSMEEMAKMLQISVATLTKKICLGDNHPPCMKLGRKNVFRVEDFEEWLAKKPLKEEIRSGSQGS